VVVQLLGEVFAGILCSDRCASYLKYHKDEGQFCWAHYLESAVIQSDSRSFALSRAPDKAHFKRNILGVLEIAKTTDAERFCRMRWLCTPVRFAYGIGSAPAPTSDMARSRETS
jgi:hypothetical protein